MMTFKDWTNYFESNKDHFSKLNLMEAKLLSNAEQQLIRSSLQQFQRGENSEGKSLLKYAKDLEDQEYIATIKIFIKEEQTHALVLGRYMELNSIPKIQNHWVDNVFRSLRKIFSLENSIIVLLTAEIIAAVYYQALRDATQSQVLKSICDQILKDEEMHINFQSFTLKQFHDKQSSLVTFLVDTYRKILLSGTILVVWHTHNKVLKEGNFNLTSFWKANFKEFFRSNTMIQGKSKIEIRRLEALTV